MRRRILSKELQKVHRRVFMDDNLIKTLFN